MIDRQAIRVKVCHTLQTEYVALLGQRGVGLKTAINTIMNEGFPSPNMKFMFVPLPRNVHNLEEFKELFLSRLTEAASHVPSETELATSVSQVLKDSATRSVDFRMPKALDTLGKRTTANYLVVVLHALAEIPEEPLKHLLLTLREYHDQMRMNQRGVAGEKLRFLVVGGVRLWHLCFYKTRDISPFNIAQRIFLSGLSPEEIQAMDKSDNFEIAVKLRDLTDGVPSLIEQIINELEDSDDLSPLFKYLHKYWTSLPVSSQEILKRLALASENFPHCVRDYNCPEIPVIDSPWMEAFWGGFLRMRHHELAWRSPVHQAFVMEFANKQGGASKSTFMKIDLLDRVKRLERALKNTSYSRDWDENVEEAVSLAIQTDSAELASILQMVQKGEREDIILDKVGQLVEKPERVWFKELAQQAAQHTKNIAPFLIKGVILGTKRSIGNFDVFLCHNGDDKAEVKQIGEELIKQGILPWLDEWELRPGEPWQRVLEQQIERIKSVAILVGKNGMGPWQQMEVEAFLREFVKRGCPVIPVLLPYASQEPPLPIFLRGMTWVDFRKQNPDPMNQLIWGITGKHGSVR